MVSNQFLLNMYIWNIPHKVLLISGFLLAFYLHLYPVPQNLIHFTGGGNCGDLDDIINDLCALEAELNDAQKELSTKQPMTDGDSGNVDDMYSSVSVNHWITWIHPSHFYKDIGIV